MSNEPKILVIDDERQILHALHRILTENHFQVMTAGTGAEGLALAATAAPDVIILDLGLPDMDGTKVCENLRGWTQTPIIVLSARDEQLQKISALDKGADDYLTKPFDIEELMAHVRVALRHSARMRDNRDPVITCGMLCIDLVRHIVTRDEEEVKLTATEFNLLAYLARNADRVITHRTLLSEIWGLEYTDQIDYLRVYMRQLRVKLEVNPRSPKILLTEPGVGYRFSTRSKE